MKITVSFNGINSTIGLLGDEAWTRIIILAPTNLNVLRVEGEFIAGEKITFSGILTDEHSDSLFTDESPSGGIIHLFINDIDVGPLYTTQSNGTTRSWSIVYDIPEDINYGLHKATMKFLGGFTWVDPMGQGDSLNPEYYLPSSDTIDFNISQVSKVIITTSITDVDRNDLVLIEGQFTDLVNRPIPDRSLNAYIDEQLLTELFVNETGFFSIYVPISPNMKLGPRIISVEFMGEEFILPSNSSTVFIVHGPVYPIVNELQPIAVGDILEITGLVKDNLQDGFLSNHTLELFVDDVLIGITTSNNEGYWYYDYIIPETLEIGNHTFIVLSPEQGYHRQGIFETNLTVAYHTKISLSLGSQYATRGDNWNFTGRLYEDDTQFQMGLQERNILVLLDGIEISTITSNDDGTFNYNHTLGYQISRGMHEFKFSFVGELLYLSTNTNITTFVNSDIQIEILPITHTIVRSSSTQPIKIQGFAREIGGQFSIFENLSINLFFWQ